MSVIVLIFAAAITLLAAFVPVYGDESATVMMRGMFLSNGAKLNTLLPQCGSEYLFSVPWSLYPGALLSAALYNSTIPWILRAIGVMTWGVGLVVMWAWMSVWFASREGRRLGFVVLVGVGSLGVQGLVMPMVRAEQILVLMMAAYCCAPALAARLRGRVAMLLFSAAFVVATSFVFYLHPKTLFFFPLALASAILSFARRNRPLCVVVSGLVVACAVQSLVFFSAMTKCGDAPALSRIFAEQTVSPSLLGQSPLAFLTALWTNVTTTSMGIWHHALFQDTYQSAWLVAQPGLTNHVFVRYLNTAIDASAFGVFVLACVLPGVALASWVASRLSNPNGWLLLTLWAAFIGHAAIYRVWNFYTGVPMMYMASALVIISLSMFRWRSWAMYGALLSAFGATGLLIATVAVLGFPMAPRIVESALHDSTLAEQPFSVPTFRYRAERDLIRRVAAQCGIPAEGGRRLIVDPMSLGAFSSLSEPLESDYLFTPSFGADLMKSDGLEKLLRKTGATRFVGRCTFLPAQYAPIARREGQICCFDLDTPR
ncbi:hypothetical protein [Pandoraea sputorum]|uniref:hypothetical protein n=1 Tax=Pandoraea sputorum TaxID=93222 RepID=UPI001240DB38|nr:hypothetical protein [Pandoraea sputorum]